MTPLLKIAFRNILRNRRRSFMTGSAVAAGAMAMLLFGGFTNYIFTSIETRSVQATGHLTVFRSGYFLFGAGNSAAYGIGDYRAVMEMIRTDGQLGPMINVLTPTQSMLGIAGNFSGGNDASKTFLGVGLVPSDRDRMRRWDEYGTGLIFAPDSRLSDQQPTHGLVGKGLARILLLCQPLSLADCPAPAAKEAPAGRVDQDLADLAGREAGPAASADALPKIDLLAATAGGAPNVVDLSVAGAEPQGVREMDDNYVMMPLGLAQQLVYGRGEHKVTGIVVQLHRSEDMAAARARLNELIRARGLDLEVRDFAELNPFYGQVKGMFSAIFLFISLVMGVIVLFAVVNTMTMNVMERTSEIGTIRALGVKRGGIRWQFILEGALIGAIGATVGAVIAFAVAAAVNRAGVSWIPPGNANPVPLAVYVANRPGLILRAWVILILVSTGAALLPANRAARLSVVDALRHV
jgi:putative ABC transport system permease protein